MKIFKIIILVCVFLGFIINNVKSQNLENLIYKVERKTHSSLQRGWDVSDKR